MQLRLRIFLATAAAGILALATLGASNSAQSLRPAKLFRPQPQATVITGNSTGPLFYVENDGTTALATFGIIGAVGGGPFAIGLIGYGANAAQGNIGALGYDIGPAGIAGAGYAEYPVQATTTSSNATIGLEGIAPNGNGVVGQTSVQNGSGATYAGVTGIDNSSDQNHNNDGVLGKTTNGGWGIEGTSSDNATGGVHGYATTGTGVQGNSTFGSGVVANSTASYGLYATGATAGVYSIGMGGGSYGVEGFGSTGILGDGSLVGVSGMASSASGTGLMGQCVMSTCNPLLLNNHSGTATFYVTDGGDIYAHGTLHAFLRTRDGNVAKTYAPTSTLPTIEDFGSGQIVNGAGIVHIDPSFANMSDEAGYQVFLTPQGDNHGLYVTQKTAATFAVRESMGGRSTLAFDYRIVARQNGHSGERAAIARTASDLGEPIRAIPHPQMLQAPKTPRAARTTADTHTVPDLARRLRNP